MVIEHIESPEQFRAATEAADVAVACFSAPWCGGCKLVAPQMETLAQELSELRFVGVSADNMEPLIEELEVASFPTFRVYKGGEVLGEFTSSKFDKVEEFIRSHIASDAPEADAKDGDDAPVASDDVPMIDATTPPMSPAESASESDHEEEESASASKKRVERDEDAGGAHEPSPKKVKADGDAGDQEAAVLETDAADTKMAGEETDETAASVDTANTTSEEVEFVEEDEEMAAIDAQEKSGSDEKQVVADKKEHTANENEDLVAVEESDSVEADAAPAPAPADVDDAATSMKPETQMKEETTEADVNQDVAEETEATQAMQEAVTDDTIGNTADVPEANVSEDTAEAIAAEVSEEAEATEASATTAESTAVDAIAAATEEAAPAETTDADAETSVAEADTAEEAEATTTAQTSTDDTSMDGDAATENSAAMDVEKAKAVEDGSSTTADNAIAA